MEFSNVVALCCLGLAIPQGLGAFYSLVERSRRRKKELAEGIVIEDKSTPLGIAVLMLLGTILIIVFGTWMFVAKPFRPIEKIVTVTVEKPVQCPPSEQKAGPATARGGRDAVAHSGSGGDTLTISPEAPAKPPAQNPH